MEGSLSNTRNNPLWILVAILEFVVLFAFIFGSDTLNNQPGLPSTGPGEIIEVATDIAGQINSTDDPYYTAGSTNNAPNAIGFNGAASMAVDEEHHRLYIADGANNRVLVFLLDEDNKLVDRIADFVLGQPDFKTKEPDTDQNSFALPYFVAYDPVSDLLYVSDVFNFRVLVFDVTSIQNNEDAVYVIGEPDFTTALASTSKSNFNQPRGLAIDSEGSRLFAVDGPSSRVLVFDISPTHLASAASGEGTAMAADHVIGQSTFTDINTIDDDVSTPFPDGVAYEASTNHLFVTSEHHRVTVFDVAEVSDGEPAINVLGQLTFSGVDAQSSATGMSSPNAVAVDPVTHTLFVSDQGNNRVLVYDVSSLVDGEAATFVLGQVSPDADPALPALTQSGMTGPLGVALSHSGGQLFVADASGNRILVFNTATISDGIPADDLLGQLDEANQPIYTVGLADNGPNPQGFDTVSSVEIDPVHHRLFTAEIDNNRIMVFNLDANDELLDHTADFVLGQTNFKTYTAGLSSSTLTAPAGLAYDGINDRLFVSDTGNNRILVYNTAEILNGETASIVLGQSDFDSGAAGVVTSPGHLAYDQNHQRLFAVNGVGGYGPVLIFDADPLIMGNGDGGSPLSSLTTFLLGDESVDFMGPTQGLVYDIQDNLLFATTTFTENDDAITAVLVYDVATIETDEIPIHYLGNFELEIPNISGLSTDEGPEGLAYDESLKLLYVSDRGYNRVMVWDVNEITDGEDAVEVIGQADFVSAVAATSQSGFTSPSDLAIGSPLFVGDNDNNRVMIFGVETGEPTPTDTPPNITTTPGGGTPHIEGFTPRSILLDDGALSTDVHNVKVTIRADMSENVAAAGIPVNIVLSNDPAFTIFSVFPGDSSPADDAQPLLNGGIEWKRNFLGWDLCFGISPCLPGQKTVYARFYVDTPAPSQSADLFIPGQIPACKPRPACLNSSPVCTVAIPPQGWCQQVSAAISSYFLQ